MKPCPSCGSEIHEEALGCRYCGLNFATVAVRHDPAQAQRSLKVGIAMVLGALALGVLAIVGLSWGILKTAFDEAERLRSAPPIATRAEFEQIQVGMSYAEVEAIVGAPGEPFNWANDAEDRTEELYRWINPDRSILSVWFEGGKVVHRQGERLK